jgi:3-deoxy-D-manno-octulosonic-acid transferase
MILFYHILVSIGFVLVLPVLPVVWLVSKKRRANLLQRMGMFTGIKKTGFRKPVWIHALSVGEVQSALPLVIGIRNRCPETPIVFTAATRTGLDTARALFCRPENPLVARIAYFPFDLPWAVARIRRLISPGLVCLVETDLWPGFVHAMARKQIPVVLVNARLSARSFKGYRRLGPLAGLFFSKLTHVLAQTRQDLERFNALGVSGDCLTLAGNIKFDQPLRQVDPAEQAALRHWFGLSGDDRLWLAGSTHTGEERLVFSVFQQVRNHVPGLKLIIAPRDPGRCRQVAKELAKQGGSPVFLSQIRDRLNDPTGSGQDHPGGPGQDHPTGPGQNPPAGPGPASQNNPSAEDVPETGPVMLLDCLGVLASAYAVCDVAFVGGSLVPCGGHNPLEPAMFKKPMVLGPHMDDFSEIAALLLARNAACQATDANSLALALKTLLTRPDHALGMGARAFSVFKANAGAVDRTLDCLAGLGLGDGHV